MQNACAWVPANSFHWDSEHMLVNQPGDGFEAKNTTATKVKDDCVRRDYVTVGKNKIG